MSVRRLVNQTVEGAWRHAAFLFVTGDVLSFAAAIVLSTFTSVRGRGPA